MTNQNNLSGIRFNKEVQVMWGRRQVNMRAKSADNPCTVSKIYQPLINSAVTLWSDLKRERRSRIRRVLPSLNGSVQLSQM